MNTHTSRADPRIRSPHEEGLCRAPRGMTRLLPDEGDPVLFKDSGVAGG